MNISSIMTSFKTIALPWLLDRAPAILAGIGGIASAAAVGEAIHATVKTVKEMEEKDLSWKDEPKEIVKTVAKNYLPTAALLVVAEGCIFGGLQASTRKAAALTAMYEVANNQNEKLVEFTEDVLEKNKSEEVKNKDLESYRIEKGDLHSPYATSAMSWPKPLIKDSVTGQIFNANPEEISKVANHLNRDLYTGMDYFTHNDFLSTLDVETCDDAIRRFYTADNPLVPEFVSGGVTTSWPHQPYILMTYENEPKIDKW